MSPPGTVPGPDELAQLCDGVGPQRLIFSLDLKDSKPLTFSLAWRTTDTGPNPN